MICPDSSVAVKWTFVEEHSTEARLLLRDALRRQETIVAPPLLCSEVANTIRQYMRRGQVRLEEARAVLTGFLALPIALYGAPHLYERALVLANEYNMPAAYDAQYVALAELAGATFWTADQKLLRLLGGTLPYVRWIGEYKSQDGG